MLTAHIDLMNVCHADHLIAIERECGQKIGAVLDDIRAIVAKVVPPDLEEGVQITISGRTARELWGGFACLRDDDSAHELPQAAGTCRLSGFS